MIPRTPFGALTQFLLLPLPLPLFSSPFIYLCGRSSAALMGVTVEADFLNHCLHCVIMPPPPPSVPVQCVYVCLLCARTVHNITF